MRAQDYQMSSEVFHSSLAVGRAIRIWYSIVGRHADQVCALARRVTLIRHERGWHNTPFERHPCRFL